MSVTREQLAEDYPDLKASEGFRQLHESLVEVEEHLRVSVEEV